jgi:putative ABC transport system permease protein
MGCIAGISLLVGGIGIMNIMLASVLERTREIGVRRAVGARRADIRFQFVSEAFALSLVGGLLGVVLGVAIARVVAVSAGWPTVVTAFSLALSTGVSAAVGLASGIYPAMRAANLDPIEALRYE